MVTHGTGGELHAVADEVVLVGGDAQRVNLAALGLEQHLEAAGGHGERVVAELQLAALVADLVHREVDDPAELVALLVHVTLAGGAEGLDHHADELGGQLAARDEHERVGLERQELRGRFLVDKLCNAAGKLALFVHLEPVALRARLHLTVGEELVDLLARERAVRDGDSLDGLVREDFKGAAGKEGGDVRRGQVDAQIRLVGAVELERIEILDAAEGRLGGDVVGAELGKDRGQHVLADGENVLLRGERHLHIELVEFAGAAVTARVLITEAGRDLEITVEAGGHQKLLELLRGLRQGVELAGVLAGGNEIVARALGGGGRQDRGGDLKEVVLHHGLAQRGDDVAAQDDVLLDGGVAQVEIAVLEALRLVGLAAAVDLEGEGVVAAAAEQHDLLGHDLNVAGGLVGVFARALAHGALNGDGALFVVALDLGEQLARLNDDLRRAVEVAQDNESKAAADFAHVLHPADELDVFAGMLRAKLAAVVCTGLHHGKIHSCLYIIK